MPVRCFFGCKPGVYAEAGVGGGMGCEAQLATCELRAGGSEEEIAIGGLIKRSFAWGDH